MTENSSQPDAKEYIDLEMLRGMIACQMDLLFWLTDENAPPKEYSDPLWQACNQISDTVNAMMAAANYNQSDDPAWTIYAPPAPTHNGDKDLSGNAEDQS